MTAVFDLPVHPITVEEYLEFTSSSQRDGDLRWESTELIHGVICDVAAESALHRDIVEALHEILRAELPHRRVHSHGSVEISSTQMWAPDLYVTPADDPHRQYPSAADLLLAVEVAVSSVRTDLGPKRQGYAEAGFPEYWVVIPGNDPFILSRCLTPEGGDYRGREDINLSGGWGPVVSLLKRSTIGLREPYESL
jgi:Uma2 family endonuclease